MSNPHRYFVEERENGTIAVKGEGKEPAARVVTSETKANSLAHHFAGQIDGVVEYKDTHGRFERCNCGRCRGNR